MNKEQLRKIAANIIACRKNGLPLPGSHRKTGSDKLTEISRTEQIIRCFSKEELRLYKNDYRTIGLKEVEQASANNISIIFSDSPAFPPLLKHIYSPPDYIYVKGKSELLTSECIAIVGARKHTPYAGAALELIIPDLCRTGITVVSGMAYGIDSIAHKKVLENRGNTIGVNAAGLLHLYPAGNRSLTYDISEKGCIISEQPLHITPRPFHFPVRNRIISGISSGTLVVEAEFKSGSLITAGIALEQNREVMAIPGPITSPLSKGTNHLIINGATPITSAKEIADTLGIPYRKRAETVIELNSKEKKLLDLMVENKVISIDYMVEHLNLTVSEVVSTAMGMVLKNAITEEPGGYRKII